MTQHMEVLQQMMRLALLAMVEPAWGDSKKESERERESVTDLC